MGNRIQNKREMENRARITLGLILEYDISCLVCKDMPDLQDDVHSVGIEVVEDCYEDERERERCFSGYYGKAIAEIPEDKISRFESNGAKLHTEKGVITRASLGPIRNNDPSHLIETIRKKLVKLNQGHYAQFNRYDLYIFDDTVSLYPSYLETIMDAVGSIEAKKKFSVLYIDGFYKMAVCNLTDGSRKIVSISEEMRQRISDRVQEDG